MTMNTIALVSASTDGPALLKLSITFAIASASFAHPSTFAVRASATVSDLGVLGNKIVIPNSRKDNDEITSETPDIHAIIRPSCISKLVD
jgi:hypothetical protein